MGGCEFIEEFVFLSASFYYFILFAHILVVNKNKAEHRTRRHRLPAMTCIANEKAREVARELFFKKATTVNFGAWRALSEI